MNQLSFLIPYCKVLTHRLNDLREFYLFNVKKRYNCAINKRAEVSSFAKHYGCNVLVETGTYLGEMDEFQREQFENIYSIEISDYYYEFSKNRLAKYKNIEIMKGNSADLLPEVLRKIPASKRIIFWLDGHYSGGKTGKGEEYSPIVHELKIIVGSGRKDIILIDDARCFDGNNGYPTIAWVEDFCEKNNLIFMSYDDIIRLVPKI